MSVERLDHFCQDFGDFGVSGGMEPAKEGDYVSYDDYQKLLEALESLCDEQNGPPLILHAKPWNEAMRRAYELLGRTPWEDQE